MFTKYPAARYFPCNSARQCPIGQQYVPEVKIKELSQITDGISAGMGIDLKSLIMGALGGKLLSSEQPPVVVLPQDSNN